MRRRAQRGFTLLETLVAVTMLALLCGALMPLFQQGLTLLERGDRHGRAVLLAQGLLESQVAAGGSAEPQSGQSGGFEWEVSREAYDASTDGGPPLDAETATWRLARLVAQVRWEGGGDGVRLDTLVLEREE